MAQPAVNPAPSRADKFAPRTQEVRNKFARIKRELRHIRRLIASQPPKTSGVAKA